MQLPGYTSKYPSILYQVLIYALAFALVWWIEPMLPYEQLWLKVLVLDVIATVFIWLSGVILKNASMYDPYWSVIPIVISAYLFYQPGAAPHDLREILVFSLVFYWGARLTINFWYGWPGFVHEDWRYIKLREDNPKIYQFVNLFGICMLPTLWVFAGCLPLFSIMGSGQAEWGLIDCAATVLGLIAMFFETVGDIQLHRFMANKKPGETLETGLWKYTRHPNYFGEVTFWWSLALYGLASSGFLWWHWIGALSITILFVFISIPMLEKRSLERRPQYAEVMKRVPMLFPWFPKKG